MEPRPVARRVRLALIAVLALHGALLAAYTLPEAWVPASLRAVSTAYARPLFHQGWTLFAPDPPRCSCALEVGIGNDWRPIDAAQDHYLATRMARNLAAYLDGARPFGDTLYVEPMLMQAVRAMVRDVGREVPGLRFRAVQRCVSDDRRPLERTLHIVPLEPVTSTTP